MDKKALLELEAPCRHALSLICVGLGLESRMPRNGARPVREGAVGFPSPEGAGRLPHKCLLRLAPYFIQKSPCDN